MFLTRQPIQHAQQVHGGSRQQMLKMDFCHANIASTAHPQPPNRLRNHAFNTGSLLVGFLKHFRLFDNVS